MIASVIGTRTDIRVPLAGTRIDADASAGAADLRLDDVHPDAAPEISLIAFAVLKPGSNTNK